MASSAGIISLVFIYVAYQPGADNQTASSLAGITTMETLLPALFHLLLAFAIRACKLNNPMMARIASDCARATFSPKESVMSVMEVDLHKLKITDPFLGQYQQLVRDVVIPYQWDALNDRIDEADPSHAIEKTSVSPPGVSKANFTVWFFRTVTWRNGWKPSPGRCARSQIASWKRPLMK